MRHLFGHTGLPGNNIISHFDSEKKTLTTKAAQILRKFESWSNNHIANEMKSEHRVKDQSSTT